MLQYNTREYLWYLGQGYGLCAGPKIVTRTRDPAGFPYLHYALEPGEAYSNPGPHLCPAHADSYPNKSGVIFEPPPPVPTTPTLQLPKMSSGEHLRPQAYANTDNLEMFVSTSSSAPCSQS